MASLQSACHRRSRSRALRSFRPLARQKGIDGREERFGGLDVGEVADTLQQ